MAALEGISPTSQRGWLEQFFRPVHPEELTAEERFEYTQFLSRARSFVLIKGATNAAIFLLYLFTVLPRWPATVLVALVDGLLLIPYVFVMRRWPVLSTTVLLTLTALAISTADAVSGYQTSTSGVLYVILIVAAAVLLLHTRSIAIVTASITATFLITYLLEIPAIWGGQKGIIPVQMSLETTSAMIRVLGLHMLAFLGVGAISGVLTRMYRQLLQTRSQRGLLTALLEGFHEISANLDLHTLLQRIAERAVATLPDADRAMLLIQENEQMVVQGAAGYEPLSPVGWRVSLEQMPENWRDAPTKIKDMPEGLARLFSPQPLERLHTIPPSRVTLIVPLQLQEASHILLAVTNCRRPDAFDAEAQQILNLFTHQAAVAIENAHLFAESQSRLQQALALHRIGQEIASHLQMHDLVPAIYQHIQEAMEAPSFIIAVQSSPNGELTLLSPIDLGQIFPDTTISTEGIVGWVIRNGRSLRCSNLLEELAAYPEIRLQTFGHKELIASSVLAVPLMVGNQVIGALSVQSLQPDAYGEDDERLLSSLANYVAVAVQNARLYNEVQEKQMELQGLISAVSQRLQPPVEALAGFARLLQEGAAGRLSLEERDYLERIERNSHWIAQLVQDMLFLSRMDQIKEEHEPIALSTLARGVSTHLELERQGVAIAIQEEMPVIYADPVLMWTLLRNLLQNAHRLLHHAAAPRIEVGCTALAEAYRMHVWGNGETLSAQDLARLFELFFPVGSAEGAGIGLAIAQRIGQHYGSQTWAEAAAAGGTTLYVLLPKALGKEPEGTNHGETSTHPGR
jgi:K+-sensing histidine kinase KdpD